MRASLPRTLMIAWILVVASACGGDIRRQWEERQASEPPILRDIPPIGMTQGPYHLALRYGPDTMTLLVRESIASRIASGQLGGSSMGADSPLAGKVEIGDFKLVDCSASFPEDLEGVFRASVKLSSELKFKSEPGKFIKKLRGPQAAPSTRSVGIAPQIDVLVKMRAGESDGRPALLVDVTRVERFVLNPEKPLPVAALAAKIQEAVRQKIEAQLLDSAANPDAHKVMVLPERLGKGDSPVKLLGAGLTLVPGAQGEMFLGFVTNLNAPPDLTLEGRGPELGKNAWGMTLGENTLTIMLKAAGKAGKLPLRYSRDGKMDPEGSIIVDLEKASLAKEGFVFSARIWNIDFPAFWKHYDIRGSLEIAEGQIRPKIDGMTPGEGEGNTWVGRIIEEKQKEGAMNTVRSSARKGPPTMPLPMTGGKRSLQLQIGELVTSAGALTVMGASSVIDTPAETP